MKHIEQIQPEVAAGELSGLLLADATATAALTRLLHDWTGCDIPQTDTTPQSDVDELVPLCLSILRRHWTTPLTALGDGTTPMSLADLLRRLIGDRVQGNEALGILPANDNIPTAVSALRERKISGVPEAPDGVSLPHLLCGSTIPPITELIDDNIGWVVNHLSAGTQFRLGVFPNLKVLSLGCVEINNRASYSYPLITSSSLEDISFPMLEVITEGDKGCIYQCQSLTKVSFPKLHTLYSGWSTNHNYDGILVECNAIKSVTLPSLKRFENRQNSGSYNCIMYNNAALEELIMPNLQELYHNSGYNHTYCVSKCPSIKKIVLGTLTEFNNIYIVDNQCSDLLHIEFGQGTNTPIYLNHWNPTDKGSLFLSNFRLYIADRLSDNGSGKTLTLSQEVRDAIHAAGIDTIITNKGWTISPVPTQQ